MPAKVGISKELTKFFATFLQSCLEVSGGQPYICPGQNPGHMGAIMNTDNTDKTRTRTIKEWAEMSGTNPDSARVKATRTFGQTHGQLSELSETQWAALYPSVSEQKSKKKSGSTKAPPDKKTNAEPPAPVAAKKRGGLQTLLLALLMLIPAVASVQNMYRVTHDIAGDELAAICLTGLFSAAPFLFVLAGVKNIATGFLVLFMVLYEAFCNFTRIYGGLTGFGKGGFPTRFLGLVTDVFETGTHGTAIALASIMAILAAATFYAAYFEINKNQ